MGIVLQKHLLNLLCCQLCGFPDSLNPGLQLGRGGVQIGLGQEQEAP